MQTYDTPSPLETRNLDTDALRRCFLVEALFRPGALVLAYTGLDRLVVGGVAPLEEPIPLPRHAAFGTQFFTERREIGIINLGGPGRVQVDGTSHVLSRLDGLYVGTGHADLLFESAGGEDPAFYLASAPAQRVFPVRKIPHAAVVPEELGQPSRASCRRLRKYIHPAGTGSAQLVMGYTEVPAGSVWNTLPPHTHSRRSEIYLYFDLADALVVHLMGEPRHTRHLLVRDRQAVLSPPWSIHMGAGTGPYRFVWVMAGENQDFGDVDAVPVSELR
ncbi:MAG: 5-dehydro-4-deoxy-D-glucuronate isomerase [Luteitalea sp.]|nr:5-dehydro-4-deoxy-D-glucuronate isomerase [Luteitalea sp.]